MTPKGRRTYEPRGAQGASGPVGGSNRKREELDEERKGWRGLDVGAGQTAKGTEWNWLGKERTYSNLRGCL